MIRPVSSVSFSNNYVAFEAKKDSANKHHLSNPVTKKLAVPTAAMMLAMMPMHASNNYDMDVDSPNKTEYVQGGIRKVLQRATIKNASPLYGDCTMELISEDDGETGCVVLNFKEYTKCNGFITENGERKKVPMIKTTIYALELDTLKTVNIQAVDQDNRLMVDGKEFYVCGPTRVISVFADVNDANNVYKIHNSEERDNKNIEITKEFYSDLKDFLGDLIPYKTENRKERLYNPF